MDLQVSPANCVSAEALEAEALLAVEKATADLATATQQLRVAEQELGQAKADLHAAQEMKHRFGVIIIYNGVERPLTVERSELIKSVLERAIKLFGSPPNPHTLSLFTADGRELADQKTVGEEHIHPKEKLLLRPGTVKGG
jgi:hypothetical protein